MRAEKCNLARSRAHKRAAVVYHTYAAIRDTGRGRGCPWAWLGRYSTAGPLTGAARGGAVGYPRVWPRTSGESTDGRRRL
jgi:hypothetical protein